MDRLSTLLSLEVSNGFVGDLGGSVLLDMAHVGSLLDDFELSFQGLNSSNIRALQPIDSPQYAGSLCPNLRAS